MVKELGSVVPEANRCKDISDLKWWMRSSLYYTSYVFLAALAMLASAIRRILEVLHRSKKAMNDREKWRERVRDIRACLQWE